MKKIFKCLSILILFFLIGCTTSLKSGTYQVEVNMEGGSGRASIVSPTTLVIEDEKKEVQIVWSSPYYDYMIVNGEKYENEATEGNSTFIIPVQDLDQELRVIADTTAMSVPHEIEYTLTFKIVE